MLSQSELEQHLETIRARLEAGGLSVLELRREIRTRVAEAAASDDPLVREILAGEQQMIEQIIVERAPPAPSPEELAKSNPTLAWQIELNDLQQKIADQTDINAAYGKEGKQIPNNHVTRLASLQKQLGEFPPSPLKVQENQRNELRQQSEALRQKSASPELSDEEVNVLHSAAHDLAEQAMNVGLDSHVDAAARAEQIVQAAQDSAL